MLRWYAQLWKSNGASLANYLSLVQNHFMADSTPLPRTSSGLVRLQIFVDPLYGSERYIEFQPEWLASAENKLLRTPLIPWRKFATTRVQLRSGRRFTVSGYWAEQLRSAMEKAEPNAANPETSNE